MQVPCGVLLSGAVSLGCEACLVLSLSTLGHAACKVTAQQGLGDMLRLHSVVRSLCSCHKLGCEDFLELTLACWSRRLYKSMSGGVMHAAHVSLKLTGLPDRSCCAPAALGAAVACAAYTEMLGACLFPPAHAVLSACQSAEAPVQGGQQGLD